LNSLGNCARQLKDPKQANHFYRQALKVNNTFVTAFNNLAASMANVDTYDEQIPQAIADFEHATRFYLPGYKNNFAPNEGEDYESTCQQLRKAIKENWKSHSIAEGRTILQNDIFNLGLFALANQQTELALENFEKLKSQHSQIEHLDMVLALAKSLLHEGLKAAIATMQGLLKSDPNDSLLNGNLGLLYKKAGNRLLAVKCFLVCHSLLELNEGFFTREAIERAADRKLEERDYKNALRLYKTASQQSTDPGLWAKLANLFFQLNEIPEALNAYQRLLALDPKSDLAIQKLRLIFDSIIVKGEDLAKEKKYQQAAVIFERALQIERPPALLEETAKIYKKLRQFEKAETLLEECKRLQAKNENAELENERQHYILKGKEFSKRKEFTAAIENMENAAKIKLDKDVFMYLAHIYKGLKRTRALQDLMNRWHKLEKTPP
jgi:tetratricopeptide (TPR) repeat protein